MIVGFFTGYLRYHDYFHEFVKYKGETLKRIFNLSVFTNIKRDFYEDVYTIINRI